MNKFKFAGVCLLILLSFKVLADKPKVKGYYVDNNMDTISALLEIPLQLFTKKVEILSLQHSIVYFDKKGKEIRLRHNDALGFGFVYQGERYTFSLMKEITIPMVGEMHPIGTFLRLLERGNCNLYLVKTTDTSSPSDKYLFKRAEGDFHFVKRGTFSINENKDLAEFFSDCETLAIKIKNKGFKDSDNKYIDIAKYYNKSCKSASAEKESEEE